MADNNLTPKEEFLLNPVEEHNIENAAIATFETNLKQGLKVTVPIKPQQDLHGMPNPYPAGASVNLIPDGTDTSNGYVSGYYLKNDGTTASSANYYVSEYFGIDENTTYTYASRGNTEINPSVCFYDENKQFISGINVNKSVQTFTPPAGAVYARASQSTYNYQSAYPTSIAFQLEVGSTATEYRRYSNICPIEGAQSSVLIDSLSPYASKIISFNPTQEGSGNPSPNNIRPLRPGLSFQRDDGTTFTVYKGRIELHSDGTCSVISTSTWSNLGNVSWSADNGKDHVFYCNFGNLPIMSSQNFANWIYCSGYKPVEGSSLALLRQKIGNYEIYGRNTYRQLYFRDDRFTSAAEMKSHAAGIILVIPRETPITYSLSSSETVRALAYFGANAIPITFTDPSTGDPMTVYGGSLTLNEDGSADAVKTTAIVDMGMLSWLSGNNLFYAKLSNGKKLHYTTGSAYAICEKYQRVAAVYTDIRNDQFAFGSGYFNASTCSCIVRDNAYSAVADFKAAVTGCKLVYELATPQTYHFPNVGQLKAFLGENNVWSDIGNVNVKYLTQHSETGLEYRGDRALELRRRAMMADAPTIHTTVGSEETGGLASFKSYVKAPVKKIEIPFYPKQDLHGYDHPWPAGGGKNLFPYPFVDTTKTENGITFTDLGNGQIQVSGTNTGSGYANFIVQRGIDFGSEYHNFSYVSKTYTVDGKTMDFNGLVSGIGGYYSDGGVVLRVTAGATVNCTVSLMIYDASSPLTSFVPYENICPIEGHDEVNVEHRGANLLLPQWFIDNGLTQDATDPGKFSGRIALINGINILPKESFSGGQFTIKGGITGSCSVNVEYTDGASTLVSLATIEGGYTSNSLKTVKKISIANRGGSSATTTITNLQLVRGKSVPNVYTTNGTTLPLVFNQSGDHSFLPIQEGTGDPSPENVRPIHPGLTFTRDDDSVLSVYGGTLTVNADGTSNVSATHVSYTLMGGFTKGGDISGTYEGENLREVWNYLGNGPLQGWQYPNTNSVSEGWPHVVCSNLKTYTLNPGLGRILFTRDSNPYIRIYLKESLLEDVSTDIKARESINKWCYDNPIQVVYDVKTPETYTLSVTETNRALEALGLTQHIGPLYGGTITINPDGSADVVSNLMLFDIGDYTWTKAASSHPGVFFKNFNYNLYAGTILSDKYKTVQHLYGPDQNYNYAIGSSSSSSYCMMLFIKDVDCSEMTAAEFKTYRTGTKVVLSLETPETYHFSNLEQLKVWLGENNFWCDISDDITVKYWNRG